MPKYISLNDQVAQYVEDHRYDTGDALLAELREQTLAMGDISGMQISPGQGAFMSILVAAIGAKTAVEVGTFTGYSAVCTARALPAPPDGKLHCFDISEPFTNIARQFWKRAGLSERIELHLGPAADMLPRHCPDRIDFAFIDADKTGYDGYYEFLLPRMRTGGLMVFDNMLRDGQVVDESKDDVSINAIRALNRKLADDGRVESVLVEVADGLNICRAK